MAVGFGGLRMLMEERPQFAGRPLRFHSTELTQESPSIVYRKVGDDVSVVRPTEADRIEVSFKLKERKDYRGLRTVIDLGAEFSGTYTITNRFDEAIFALFRFPHPQGAYESTPINAGSLVVDAGESGLTENSSQAWYWSGEVDAGQSRAITVSYDAANLSGVRYTVDSDRGVPIKFHRVSIEYEDPDIIYLESSQTGTSGDNSTVWERNDFFPSDYFVASISGNRNIYSSLAQLLEIGPLISLLFMISTLSVVLTRRRLTPLQVMTISAGYAFYFPLILYLSALFRFNVALLIALVGPGALLLNYSRWLLGVRAGLFGGMGFLALFQVFPTLAAFAGWNRGLVLLCLGIATLFVLIKLQNYAMKRGLVALALTLSLPSVVSLKAENIKVLIQGEIVSPKLATDLRVQPLVSFSPAQYQMKSEERYAEIGASLTLQVVKTGAEPIQLFDQPVFLSSWRHPENVQLITTAEGIQLHALAEGEGDLELVYRVPITRSGSRRSAVAPVLNIPAGVFRFESDRPNLEFQNASLWRKTTDSGKTTYEVGVIGNKPVTFIWPGAVERSDATDPQGDIYGVKIVESKQLTVIHSDGACTHLAEFLLTPSYSEELHLQLPDGSAVLSASVDGVEIAEPAVDRNRCSVPLDRFPPSTERRRVALRLSYPKARLGFIGFTELELPIPDANIGILKWFIVFPSDFRTQIITSGMDLQKGEPDDLNDFGDFGYVLKSSPALSLSKNLVAPRAIRTRIKYSQTIEGMSDDPSGQ